MSYWLHKIKASQDLNNPKKKNQYENLNFVGTGASTKR